MGDVIHLSSLRLSRVPSKSDAYVPAFGAQEKIRMSAEEHMIVRAKEWLDAMHELVVRQPLPARDVKRLLEIYARVDCDGPK